MTFDLLILKVVSESCVTWATSVPILIFLGLSVFNLGPMYATDRRQTDRRQTASSLNAPPIRGGGMISNERIKSTVKLDGILVLTDTPSDSCVALQICDAV